MGYIKTAIIALLLVILTFNIMLLEFNIVTNMTFMQPDYYDKIFAENQVYGQLRQWSFGMIKDVLPYGLDGLPYIQKVLTDDWIRQESKSILEGLISFFKGIQDDLPVLPFYKLKENLYDKIDTNKTGEQRRLLIDLWLGALPDKVRIKDFASTDKLWAIRSYAKNLRWTPWLLFSIYIIIIAIVYFITSSIEDMIACCSASLISASILSTIEGIVLWFTMPSSSLVSTLVKQLTDQNFQKDNIMAVLNSFMIGFVIRLGIISAVVFLCGYVMLNYISNRKLEIV